jgi:hypothetical protein
MGIPFAPTGSIAPPAGDKANLVIAGTFTTTGTSVAAPLYGVFNLAIYGASGPNGAWAGTVQLERSYDAGTTWIVAGVGGGGAQAVYATGADVSVGGNEGEEGVGYRVRCASYTSGVIHYRISTTGVLGTSNGVPS